MEQLTCTVQPYAPITKLRRFTISVEVPVGFVASKNAETGEYDYHEYISLDASNIKRVQTNQAVKATFHMPKISLEGVTTTDTVDLECDAYAHVFKVQGTVVYNAILSGFIAENDLNTDDSQGEIEVIPSTAFTNDGIIEVDELIAYACPGCDIEEWFDQNYIMELIEYEQFLIDNNGNRISYRENPSAFFEALGDAKNSQIIHIPVELRLVKKPEA